MLLEIHEDDYKVTFSFSSNLFANGSRIEATRADMERRLQTIFHNPDLALTVEAIEAVRRAPLFESATSQVLVADETENSGRPRSEP